MSAYTQSQLVLRRCSVFVLAVVLFVFFGAFGFAQESRLPRVRIGYPSMSMALLPALAVREKGFDTQEGIWIELVQARPSVSVVGLISGEFDFDVGIPSAVQAAAAQDLPIRVILEATKAPLFTFMVQRSIRGIGDLKRGTVAVTAMGGATHLITQAILESHGLKPGTDIRVIAIGGGMPAVFSALNTGNIDGALVSLPWQVRLEQRGFKGLAEASDYVRFPTNGLVAKADKLQMQKEKVRRVVRAHIRALRYLHSEKNTEEIVAHIRRRFNVDSEIAIQSLKRMRVVWSENGVPSKEGVEQILRMSPTGKIDPGILDRLVDFSIATEVSREAR
jgi:ABC-type nitrate/sulfonate/bicarbonate transport system substrate-binding protein